MINALLLEMPIYLSCTRTILHAAIRFADTIRLSCQCTKTATSILKVNGYDLIKLIDELCNQDSGVTLSRGRLELRGTISTIRIGGLGQPKPF